MKWFLKVVKRLTGKEKTSKVIGPILNDNNKLEYEDKGKANALNTFFSNVEGKLAKKYPYTHANDHSYVGKITPTLLEVSNIDDRLEKGIGKCKMEMDRGNFVGIVLIDFGKAFDTVDIPSCS